MPSQLEHAQPIQPGRTLNFRSILHAQVPTSGTSPNIGLEVFLAIVMIVVPPGGSLT